jgi:hypothetical protein
MKNLFIRGLVIVFSFCLTMNVRAERDACDFASNIEVGVSKKFFKRLELGFKESVSFDQNSKHLDKVSSKVDVSCTVVRKIFKVGVSYYAISKHREENYFFNQRFQGYTNVKYSVQRFTFAWRSRFQATYRPEKSDPKIWKNYWRNALTVSFKIPKVPLTPSLSAEMFYRVNDYKGNVIDKMRYEGALKYQFNKKNSLKVYYQFNDAMNVKEPLDVSAVGLAYSLSL